MKTIIVITDYSKQSEHAARYAIHLAKKIKANILLLDATVMAKKGLAVPPEGFNYDFEDSAIAENDKLLNLCKLFETDLEKNSFPGKFLPAIHCRQGSIQHDEAISFEKTLDVAFIVAGTDLYYGAFSIMAGNTCAKLLELANSPIILVPEDAPIRYAEKYAYVTDINNSNVPILTEVAELAAYSAAEVMLVNINNGRPLDEDQEKALKAIMKETVSQIDYGRIYYRHLPNDVLKSDLEWLMQNNRFEMLVLPYQKHEIIRPLLQFNYTGKLLGNVSVPLLIYPINLF
jgi:nucleotide-binding universal stress UspA family protein